MTGSHESQNPYISRNWRDLIRPRKLEVDPESLTPTYGKFTCEPLERGFGTTLGNGLRRILLSSLQGVGHHRAEDRGRAARVHVASPAVVEDVTDIVLNLKEVLLKSADAKPRVLRLEKDGEGRVTAADIQLTDGVEVLNPDHIICTCSKGAKLRAELYVGTGRGYVHADRNKTADHAGRRGRDRLAVLADPQGELPGHQRARRSADRLRPSDARGLDERLGSSRRRRGVRRQDPQGPAEHLHQLRGGLGARPRGARSRRSSRS